MDGTAGCARVLEDLSAYLDAELPEERAAEVARHLETCAPCRKAYEQERALKTRLKARVRRPVPADVARRIRARLLQEEEGEGADPGDASH